ncbi:hypothetical protein [Bifidobacterium choerinum]|uniref:Uncharacterized protein n=1 Tax=Bifidobacterium choerinum TaxID=35760 RepID=A0A087AH78_9BIFI|nr:hypothetical protein [Bifidobacterium choerinum]ATU20110.1 hypothetical protein BcFMB_03240 [Bifidobacterium choerinum]KFI58128.1 hypothetical protein BCHO_0211 [Bifidobacterium choerinum]
MTNHDHDIQNTATNADETPTVAQQPVDSTKAYNYDFTQRPATPMYTASPTPPQNGATTRIHDKLSGKMTAFIVGISLACGLGAGVAGSAITNALHDSGQSGRHMAPFAHSTDEQLEQLMPEDGEGGDMGGMDMRGFEGGRGMRGNRQRLEGRDGSDSRDSDKSDRNGSDDSSDSDSNSEKESSYVWYGDLLNL